MRSAAYIGLAAGAVLLLGACGDGTEAHAEPTPRPISAECRQAFEEGSDLEDRDIGREQEGSVARGSLRHLRPTLEACQSPDEWAEGYRGYSTEATEGIAPSTALRSLCSIASRDGESVGICAEIALQRQDSHPSD